MARLLQKEMKELGRIETLRLSKNPALPGHISRSVLNDHGASQALLGEIFTLGYTTPPQKVNKFFGLIVV